MKCNKNGRRRRIGLTYADLHFKKSFLQPLCASGPLPTYCATLFSLLSGQNGCRFNWNRALALLYFKIHSWNIFFLSSPSRLFVQVQWWEKVGNENSSVSLKVWFARSNDNNQNAIKDILVIWIDILALVPKPERKRTLSSIKMICMPMHQKNKKNLIPHDLPPKKLSVEKVW